MRVCRCVCAPLTPLYGTVHLCVYLCLCLCTCVPWCVCVCARLCSWCVCMCMCVHVCAVLYTCTHVFLVCAHVWCHIHVRAPVLGACVRMRVVVLVTQLHLGLLLPLNRRVTMAGPSHGLCSGQQRRLLDRLRAARAGGGQGGPLRSRRRLGDEWQMSNAAPGEIVPTPNHVPKEVWSGAWEHVTAENKAPLCT